MTVEKETSKVVNVRLTASEIARVDALAAQDDRSRSSLIRRLILLALDDYQGTFQRHRTEAK